MNCLVREGEFLQQSLYILQVRSKDWSHTSNIHQIRNTEPCAASLLLQMQLQGVYILYMLSFTHLQTEPNIGLHASAHTASGGLINWPTKTQFWHLLQTLLLFQHWALGTCGLVSQAPALSRALPSPSSNSPPGPHQVAIKKVLLSIATLPFQHFEHQIHSVWAEVLLSEEELLCKQIGHINTDKREGLSGQSLWASNHTILFILLSSCVSISTQSTADHSLRNDSLKQNLLYIKAS